MIKKKFKVTDMHCSSCALTIDMALEDLEGVKKSQTSYAKAEVELDFDPEKVKEKELIEVVKKAGYTVVNV